MKTGAPSYHRWRESAVFEPGVRESFSLELGPFSNESTIQDFHLACGTTQEVGCVYRLTPGISKYTSRPVLKSTSITRSL